MLPLLLAAVSISFAAAASSGPHPLDALTAAELTAVRSAVLGSPLVRARPLHFHYVGLDEPNKAAVLSYAYAAGHTAAALPRRAFVLARAGGLSHEFRVDVAAASVLSHAVYRGPGFPLFTLDEQVAAGALPATYPPFAESVRRRGLDLGDVACGAFSMGWFGGGVASADGPRLAKMQCAVVTNATANFYARPLAGVTMVVDLERMAIVGYRDRAVYPVPKAEGTEYRADMVGPLFTGPAAPPGVVVQPEGKGFRIDGRVVR